MPGGALPAAGRPPPPLERHGPRTGGGPPRKHVPCGLCRTSGGGGCPVFPPPPVWSCPLLLAELLGKLAPHPGMPTQGTSYSPAACGGLGSGVAPWSPLCASPWLKGQPQSHLLQCLLRSPSCCAHTLDLGATLGGERAVLWPRVQGGAQGVLDLLGLLERLLHWLHFLFFTFLKFTLFS